MKHIFGERVSGKTMACFDLCRKEDAYLVVVTETLKEALQIKAEQEGYLDISSKIITFNEYKKEFADKTDKKFVVDDAGMVLQHIFNYNLIGYSDTVLDWPLENYKYLKSIVSEKERKEYWDGEEVVFKPYYEQEEIK